MKQKLKPAEKKFSEPSSKMKKTEIGMIPEDWDLKNLREICVDIIGGGTPSTQNKDYWNGSIPWMTSAHIIGRFVKSGQKFITKEGLENSATHLVEKDNLLVATRVGIGKVAINKIDVTISQDLTGLIIDKSKAFNEYVYWQLTYNQRKIKSFAQGSTIKGVLRTDLAKLDIPLPSIIEQQSISEVLSTIDSRLDIVERESQRVERLKVGLMKELFDGKKWKLQKITDIFEIETGTTPSTKVKEYWDNGTVNWITPADMNNLDNTLDLPESKRKITQKALKEVNLTLMPSGSIVISTRAPVGYIGLVKKELTFNQGCKGLIPKDTSKVNTIFYAYYLLSLQEYLNNISGGSTFKELSKDSLCKLEMPVPSISEQNEIANILLTVDKKLSIQQSKKSKLESIKKGLMNDLLTGKKRVVVN